MQSGMALMVLFALEHMRVETVLGVTAAATPVLGSLIRQTLADPSAPFGHLPPTKLAAAAVGHANHVCSYHMFNLQAPPWNLCSIPN
jgi:hypothetical protein